MQLVWYNLLVLSQQHTSHFPQWTYHLQSHLSELSQTLAVTAEKKKKETLERDYDNSVAQHLERYENVGEESSKGESECPCETWASCLESTLWWLLLQIYKACFAPNRAGLLISGCGLEDSAFLSGKIIGWWRDLRSLKAGSV